MRMLTILACAVMLGAPVGCDDKTDTTAGPNLTKVSQTVEYQLAVHHGGMVPEDHPSVAQFKTVLSSLDAKYPEDPQKIGDLSRAAHQALQAAGVNESLLVLMQNVEKAGGAHKDYASAVNAYVAARKPPGR